MEIVTLLCISLFLLPTRHEADVLRRIAFAKGIMAVTDDVIEQRTLMLIATYESGFREDVGTCKRLGDHGTSKGFFQIKPIEAADRVTVCGSFEEQAALALRYIHRAAEACPKNHGAASLNIYTSGRCEYGLKWSEHRWGGRDFPQDTFGVK